jgi:glycosyltransferase involved in cell wall biosynthesis
VEKCVDSLARKENLLLWIEGNYTFASLSTKFVNKYRHIVQIQEMFDDYGFKGFIKEQISKKSVEKAAQSAVACIVNEYNRAHLLRVFFKLKRLPYILPNKPAFILEQGELSGLHEQYEEYDGIFEKKVIIYQGLLTTGRSNFIPYLEAVKKLNEESDEYKMVFVGKDLGMVEKYRKQGYDLVNIPFVPAPNYLYFTSKAYIGIVTYIPDILNNVYCAPNKIFEYAAYGIPTIGNDIPGLRYTIESNHCGKVCDDTSESVYKQLQCIISHYDEMSLAAKEFFHATDNKSTVKMILDDVENSLGVIK